MNIKKYFTKQGIALGVFASVCYLINPLAYQKDYNFLVSNLRPYFHNEMHNPNNTNSEVAEKLALPKFNQFRELNPEELNKKSLEEIFFLE